MMACFCFQNLCSNEKQIELVINIIQNENGEDIHTKGSKLKSCNCNFFSQVLLSCCLKHSITILVCCIIAVVAFFATVVVAVNISMVVVVVNAIMGSW